MMGSDENNPGPVEGASSGPPPGWYPTPDGDKRYWDGNGWLDLPDPTATTSSNAKGTDSGKGAGQTRRPLILVLTGTLILALLAGGLFVAKLLNDQSDLRGEISVLNQQKAEEALEQQEALELQEAQAQAAQLVEEKSQRVEDEKRRSKLKDRKKQVEGIELAVGDMAKEDISKGLLEGKVLDVHCSPVLGGATEPLLQETTTFECFVATQDAGKGKLSGYYYNSTMNWDTGSYTYGFGQP